MTTTHCATSKSTRILAQEHTLPTVLTIAGSDPSGGAGIEADIKTILANGGYAMSAISAITAQNTTGVQGVFPTTSDILAAQISSVCSDITPDAVKIGMLVNTALIRATTQQLRRYHARNIVLDPLMISSSGTPLIEPHAIETLQTELFPLATLITPNIPEAQALCGWREGSMSSAERMQQAATMLSTRFQCAVLLKGGHSCSNENGCNNSHTNSGENSSIHYNTSSIGHSDDVLVEYETAPTGSNTVTWFRSERINNPNTHGTGCTLSSAIATYLARGYSLVESIRQAKNYLTGAIASQLNLGSGSGPLDHGWQWNHSN